MINFVSVFGPIGRTTAFCLLALIAGFVLAASFQLDATFVALATALCTIVAGRAVGQDIHNRKDKTQDPGGSVNP